MSALPVSRSANNAELERCPVLILAGGLGTRLRSAYDDGPKVMAPVDGRPFLWYLLTSLAKAGLEQVVLCVGYRHDQIHEWLGDGSGFGLAVSYSYETEQLGTAGALRLAHSRYVSAPRFMAMNGDSLLQADFGAMYEAHMSSKGLATMAVAAVSDTSRYGSVDIDDDGNVQCFREKSGDRVSGYINGGIYLFESAVMDFVPQGRAVSLEREVLPLLKAEGLMAFPCQGYFIDIGVPEDLARAQTELKELIAR